MALLALLTAALLVAPGALAQSEPLGQGLTLVRVDGPLDVGTQALLTRAIAGAQERGDRLVVELDTPGGEIELMWQLAKLLHASSSGVGTVAWVNDRALSAGALLALACERVYMRSHATIGSALPVQVGPGGLLPVSEDAAVREKLSSFLRAEFRGVAEKRGRPGLLAEAMVDPEVGVFEVRVEEGLKLVDSKELDDLRQRGEPHEFVRTVVERGELFNATGSEAVELGLADGLAESLDELSAKIGTAGVVPTEVHRARSEDLAAWLVALTPLLLVAGVVCLYIEFKTPGFGVAGITALAAFGLVLFGRYLVGLADIPHVILIVGGAALVAAELFLMPGTIWLGLLGAVAILGGLLWSAVGGSMDLEYGLDRIILIDESFRMVKAVLLAALVIFGLARILPRTPLYSRMVLMAGPSATAAAMPDALGAHARVARSGAAGRALTALRPVGKVALDDGPGLDFEARAEGAEIAPGARVRVVEVQPSGRLVVAVIRDEPA